MAKGKSSSNSDASSGALLGAGLLSSGAGSGIICSETDNGFTCTLKRIVSNIKAILFLCLLLFLIYYVFKNRKTIFK